ncbi:hypothetical protein GCM10022281_20350 [Sphingomonas rosea]|uniref:DUF4349 domain-containing protein n=1 Tax=Sphingomonas rosea TaxID=335605 RepID=A0ABP7UB29_9SPHN
MSFSYGSGVIAPSTDEEKPIARAFATAGLNFERAAAFLIIAGAALLPWALMAGLVIWLWRRFRIGAWLNARSDVSYARQVDPD